MSKRPKINIQRASESRNESQYFITINSNKVKGEDPRFDKRVQNLLSQIDQFVRIRPGYQEDPDMDVEIEFDDEVGEKNHRHHYHISVIFLHRTNLQLDFELLHSWAAKYKYYLEAHWVRPHGNKLNQVKMRSYIRKGKKKQGLLKE